MFNRRRRRIHAAISGRSPLTALFANGEDGALLESPRSMDGNRVWYTDVGKTTLATAIGDAVRVWEDTSGNAHDAVATSDATRPLVGRFPRGGVRNLLTYTEDFSNVAWGKVAGVLVTADAATAPTGYDSADKLYSDGVSLFPHIVEAVPPTAGQVTISILAKEDDGNFITLRVEGTDVGAASQNNSSYRFDLASETVIKVQGGDADSTSITLLESGWYICELVVTTTTATTVKYYPQFNTMSPEGVFITGAQFESGDGRSNYQKVTAAYDITEEGVPSVLALYANGSSQYMTFPGSASEAWAKSLHDGTGGAAAYGVLDTAGDDDTNNTIAGSRPFSTTIGFRHYVQNTPAVAGRYDQFISNGATDIILNVSADNVSVPNTPQVSRFTYITQTGDDAYIDVDGVEVATRAETGAPSTADAANDVQLFAKGNATETWQGFIPVAIIRDSIWTDTEAANIDRYIANKTGATLS